MSGKLVVSSILTLSSFLLVLYIVSGFTDHASPWSFVQDVIPNETYRAIVLTIWGAINAALAVTFVRLTMGKRS